MIASASIAAVVVSGVAGLCAAAITAVMAYRSKRLEANSPVSVATVYKGMFGDFERMLEILKADLAQQHVQTAELRLAVNEAIDAEQRCLVRLMDMQKELDILRKRVFQLEEGE
jgi:hypothetical protein